MKYILAILLAAQVLSANAADFRFNPITQKMVDIDICKREIRFHPILQKFVFLPKLEYRFDPVSQKVVSYKSERCNQHQLPKKIES